MTGRLFCTKSLKLMTKFYFIVITSVLKKDLFSQRFQIPMNNILPQQWYYFLVEYQKHCTLYTNVVTCINEVNTITCQWKH